MLTQSKLRRVLRYYPNTGVFVWRGSRYTAGFYERGWLRIQIAGQKYQASHLAWLYVHGVMPKKLDHKNRVRNDNRIENLRLATPQLQAANRTVNTKTQSGYKGVFRSRVRGYMSKWRARIKVDDVYVYLGMFKSKVSAAKAYNRAALHYFGEFACLNTFD